MTVCLDFVYDTSIILILCTGRTAPSTLVQGRREGWVRICIAGQTDWKHLWMVVTSGPSQEASSGPPQPTSPDSPQPKRRISFFGRDKNQPWPPSTEPLITFYLSPKREDRGQPFLILRDVTQAFAVYPERPELINKSALMKIEGTIGDEEVAMVMRKQVGWILIMPELEPGVRVPQVSEMILWLIGTVVPYFVIISTHVWHYSYSRCVPAIWPTSCLLLGPSRRSLDDVCLPYWSRSRGELPFPVLNAPLTY